MSMMSLFVTYDVDTLKEDFNVLMALSSAIATNPEQHLMEEGADSLASVPTPSTDPFIPGTPTKADSTFPRNILTTEFPVSAINVEFEALSKQIPEGELNFATMGELDDMNPGLPDPAKVEGLPSFTEITLWNHGITISTFFGLVLHIPMGANPSGSRCMV